MLGKRKRDTVVVSKKNSPASPNETRAEDDTHSHDIFRRHFETAFAPLPPSTKEDSQDIDDDSDQNDATDSEASSWDGLSETSGSGQQLPLVEVVSHDRYNQDHQNEIDKAQRKAFMSSKPPRETTTIEPSQKPKSANGDDPVEATNLKHDLDLQRLLRESHLLEKSRASETPGKERQKALDMRLQALGAKSSIYQQENMPISHRKGIVGKVVSKEALRRKQAQENGVVLEKAAKQKSSNSRRDRSVDGPGVGKFSGGTLKLSRRDVASITGPSPRSGSSRKGRKP